jgi:hypothetical protein
MDFITGLLKVQGRDYIYLVLDRLTKYAHFFAIPSEYSASQVADIFFREVFKLHGLLRYILSDRDSGFLIAFWQDLFSLSGMELKPSTNYHLQTDGNMDIMREWIEGYFHNYVSIQ